MNATGESLSGPVNLSYVSVYATKLVFVDVIFPHNIYIDGTQTIQVESWNKFFRGRNFGKAK